MTAALKANAQKSILEIFASSLLFYTSLITHIQKRDDYFKIISKLQKKFVCSNLYSTGLNCELE